MSALGDLPLIASGKVREIYEGRDQTLLIVASDRISTYDVVHPTPIPDKGAVLTGLSTFWFERTAAIVPNHLLSVTDGVPEEARGRAHARTQARDAPGRVRRPRLHHRVWLEGLPADRRRSRASSCRRACASPTSSPSRSSPRRPRPTSATTRRSTSSARSRLVGDRALAERLRDVSIAVYQHAAEHARERGIILADTKFEFGLDADGELTLGDEVCTPDSSRFWPADQYEPGRGQPSFDKQFVRDWASSTGWDRNPPAPAIPDDVVARTREKYVEAYERITGEPFDDLAQPNPMRARVLVRPKAGILDPQGQAVERALPALGFAGVRNVHVGRLIELDVDDPDAAAGDVRAAADQSADRGLRDRRDGDRGG